MVRPTYGSTPSPGRARAVLQSPRPPLIPGTAASRSAAEEEEERQESQAREIGVPKAMTASLAVLIVLGLLCGLAATQGRGPELSQATGTKKAGAESDSDDSHPRDPWLSSTPPPMLYQTCKYTDERMTPTELRWVEVDSMDSLEQGAVVHVDSKKKFQKIIGFGAAFTDAATINFYKLPESEQERLMDAYFGKDGAAYTIGRIPMNSCDFSVESYSFNDKANDYELDHFDTEVKRDQAQRIPMIKSAMDRQPDLKLFISPWSPPAWMKEPKGGSAPTMVASVQPSGLRNEGRIRDAWALYFSKFISAYMSLGVPIWGATVQNEPENPGPWEACVYNSTFMTAFVRDHLGPVLSRDHPQVHLMTYDHNKDHMAAWARDIANDPVALSYVSGMAFHWYSGGAERSMDGSYGWSNVVKSAMTLLPQGKFLLASESCNCPGIDKTFDGSWERAEKVAHDVIEDLRSFASGWVDWNLLLDHEGGPNHAGNLCDAPAYADKNFRTFTLSPMYYALAHVSRFVPPGSKRLGISVRGRYDPTTLGSRASGALVGYEATLWPCEGSIRQSWKLTQDGTLQLHDQMTEYFEYWKPVCLSREVDIATGALTLTPCDEPTAARWLPLSGGLIMLDVAATWEGSTPKTADIMELEKDLSLCLAAESIKMEGSITELKPCDKNDATQVWNIDVSNGVVKLGASGSCLTAGWPFFSSVAFETPVGQVVVVVLNQGQENVQFDLVLDGEGRKIQGLSPLHSIQTYIL